MYIHIYVEVPILSIRVRRYKLVLIETAYNVRVGPVWGVAGLVGAAVGPVGAAAPVGPAVEAP